MSIRIAMTEEDRQIRVAAETLLTSSIHSQRSSFTQHSINRTPDIIIGEDLAAGARHHGRMSDVRRSFCLFVTFDLLFTCLMWLICITVNGGSVETRFIDQVVHYHIKTSMFDIVMAAVCRFTVLLLFYALLYINHWIIIALSTAITCGFLITKVFLFDWSQSHQPVFQVLLIIVSFVLAWGETWFFDFRVIPQETQARDWLIGSTDSERAPLLRHYLSSAIPAPESVGNFYTPMDSADHSEDEAELSKQDEAARDGKPGERFVVPVLPRLSNQKVEEYKKKATTTLDLAYEFLTSNDWKVDETTFEQDIISHMNLPKPQGKIMKITGVVDMSARTLLHDLFSNIDAYATWNKLLTESKRIQMIDENTDIVYQATASHSGGLVGARDFVILRHYGERENFLISTGVSVSFAPVPHRKNFIRGENGVGCCAAEELVGEEDKRCRFTCIMNTNLKGWLPQRVIDKSLSTALMEFMSFVRAHARTLKD